MKKALHVQKNARWTLNAVDTDEDQVLVQVPKGFALDLTGAIATLEASMGPPDAVYLESGPEHSLSLVARWAPVPDCWLDVAVIGPNAFRLVVKGPGDVPRPMLMDRARLLEMYTDISDEMDGGPSESGTVH